jgi:hypothetical protein
MAEPHWTERLKQRWKLKSAWHVVIVLIVFACTGFTVLFIKQPILQALAGEQDNSSVGTILYYILILPLYNVLLLCYGFLFGQFEFFWQFEKRFFQRIASTFKKPK